MCKCRIFRDKTRHKKNPLQLQLEPSSNAISDNKGELPLWSAICGKTNYNLQYFLIVNSCMHASFFKTLAENGSLEVTHRAKWGSKEWPLCSLPRVCGLVKCLHENGVLWKDHAGFWCFTQSCFRVKKKKKQEKLLFPSRPLEASQSS